jgi:hypothetical protein
MLGSGFMNAAKIPVAEESDEYDDHERRKKIWLPGAMYLAGNSSKAIAARKA